MLSFLFYFFPPVMGSLKRITGIVYSRYCPNGLLIKPWLVFREAWVLGEPAVSWHGCCVPEADASLLLWEPAQRCFAGLGQAGGKEKVFWCLHWFVHTLSHP